MTTPLQQAGDYLWGWAPFVTWPVAACGLAFALWRGDRPARFGAISITLALLVLIVVELSGLRNPWPKIAFSVIGGLAVLVISLSTSRLWTVPALICFSILLAIDAGYFLGTFDGYILIVAFNVFGCGVAYIIAASQLPRIWRESQIKSGRSGPSASQQHF